MLKQEEKLLLTQFHKTERTAFESQDKSHSIFTILPISHMRKWRIRVDQNTCPRSHTAGRLKAWSSSIPSLLQLAVFTRSAVIRGVRPALSTSSISKERKTLTVINFSVECQCLVGAG